MREEIGPIMVVGRLVHSRDRVFLPTSDIDVRVAGLQTAEGLAWVRVA
jgi:hypothetical protein